MPTYEYECVSCGHGFEAIQSMTEAPLSDCPACGKLVRRRINGGMGVIFKGSGFYKNDARRASSPKDSSSPKEGAKEGSAAPACPGCSSGGCPAAAGQAASA